MNRNLFIIFGYPGSGKSTLAKKLHLRIHQSNLLCNDVIRREEGFPLQDSSYSPKVYEILADRARVIIKNGGTAILDATFYLKRYRKIVEDILWPCNPDLMMINVCTPPNICRERVRSREKNKYPYALSYLPAFERVVKTTESWERKEIPQGSLELVCDCSEHTRLTSCISSLPVPFEEFFRGLEKGAFNG
jgi:predicted kinase